MAAKKRDAEKAAPTPEPKKAKAGAPGSSGKHQAPGGELVPVDAPKIATPKPAGAPPKPQLPASDAVDVDVLPLIRGIIAWVTHTLRQRLIDDFPTFPNVALHQHAPLEIKSTALEKELVSYKAAWSEELATAAFNTSDRYEAGGNLFWANPFPAGKDDQVAAGEIPSWPCIAEMADMFRQPSGASSPGETVAKGKRIMFPVVLHVHAPSAADFKGKTFPGNLRVVTGHAAIYAWYLAMFEVLDSAVSAGTDVVDRVAALWQAALTVSFCGWIVENTEKLALLSMQKNNEIHQHAKLLGDSFPAFARKVALAMRGASKAEERLKMCQDMKVCFNGQPVHRHILSAANVYVKRVDDETHALIMRMEHRFGKEALTGKFNNLNRVVQLCEKEVTMAGKMWSNAPTTVLIQHVVHYLMWALEHDRIQASGITCEWLDKTRDGHPGCVNKVLAKAQMVLQLKAMASELPEDSKTRVDCLTALAQYTNYDVFNKAFAQSEGATAVGEVNEETDPFRKMRNELAKTAQMLLDFLFDVFEGQFDKDISNLCAKSNGGAIGLLQWMDLEGSAGTKWRDICRQMGINKKTVSVDDGAPPASARSLQRSLSCASSPDDDEAATARAQEVQNERLRAWRDAQSRRKKYALVSTCKMGSEADIQQWFEKQKAAHTFVGKPGEQHRVFVFSADTFGAEADEPWSGTASCGRDLTHILNFLKTQKGPYDVILAFDGRNYEDRHVMEPVMRKLRYLCEVWLVYAPSKRLGKRAVAWASDTRETGWISLPMARTLIPTKVRQSAAKDWSASTHDSTYTNVPQVPWDGLPQIAVADKLRVLAPCLNAGADQDLPKPPVRIFDCDSGMPLYWQELKPVVWWEDILHCLDAKIVVDLSPGSGSVGRACLRLGIEYLACCRTEHHSSWLANVLDRESCELIVTNQSPLFEQDLSVMLKTHFSDVLDQLNVQKQAKDTEPEEDD